MIDLNSVQKGHCIRHEFKEHKPKLLGPDILRFGGGLPREGVGLKSSVWPSKPGKPNFFGSIPGFCRDIPEVPEKFEIKKFVFNFRSLL